MDALSEAANETVVMREKFLDAGLETMRKSYYPALQAQLKQLRASERNYREIFNSTQDAIFLCEAATGAIVDYNTGAVQMFGSAPGQMLGMRIGELFGGDPRQWLVRSGDEVDEHEALLEWRCRRATGQEFWAEVKLGHSQIGGEDRILAVVRDITVRKQAQEQVLLLNRELEQRVAQRTRELQQANEDLEAFTSMVSHDLQAPLRHISSYSHLLEEAAGLDQERQGYVVRIIAGAAKLNDLVRDLLNFSKAAHGALNRIPVDLSELVREVQEELSIDCQGRKIVWRVEPMPVVSGDRTLLRQVLFNLISNALKFTKTRPETRIEITAEATRSEYIVNIIDNGVGFDPQSAGRLFKAFERLHSGQEFSGSGIGLTIVARILARHGGRVWAKGVPGSGAQFGFALPRCS